MIINGAVWARRVVAQGEFPLLIIYSLHILDSLLYLINRLIFTDKKYVLFPITRHLLFYTVLFVVDGFLILFIASRSAFPWMWFTRMYLLTTHLIKSCFGFR